MAESNIIPLEAKEIEPSNIVRVRRVRITGANQFGRPEIEDIGENTFPDLKHAYEWCANAPEYSHYFRTELPNLDLRAQMAGPRRTDQEKVAVNSRGRIGISRRTVEGHHAVSTDYEGLFDLIINLDTSQGYLFDRGIVWVTVPRLIEPPTLSFHINAGVHTSDELELETFKMLMRVRTILEDLVQGE